MKSMSDKEVVKTEEGADTKVYEVGYLLIPTVKEEDVAVLFGNMKDLVNTLGGSVIADEMPKMMQIAYPMTKVISNVRNKFTTAYFGWVKFTMESAGVLELKKKLDLDTNVLRFLITKTVKENTIAAKRFVRTDMHRKPEMKKEGDAEAMPINKEELDKEIDAMVSA